MLKKILLIGLFVLPFVFLMFSNRVVAEKECWDYPGGGPTNPGNQNYSSGWRCQCPPAAPFEFYDTSTPDTIVSGSNIDVYVTGGCAPFTLEVTSGTGATWNASGSTTLTSSNRQRNLLKQLHA